MRASDRCQQGAERTIAISDARKFIGQVSHLIGDEMNDFALALKAAVAAVPRKSLKVTFYSCRGAWPIAEGPDTGKRVTINARSSNQGFDP